MPVRFQIPGPLRPFTGNSSCVEIGGSPATVRQALQALVSLYPGLHDRIFTEQSSLREHINIFVGDELIRYTGCLDTPLAGDEEISIVPAITGGEIGAMEGRSRATLAGQVALVTGASQGVGKGIALELIDAGACVYITGRDTERMKYIERKGTAIECDHRDDAAVERALRRIGEQSGRLDILVNNVWGGYENMSEDGEFTWNRPFWQQPLWRWDAMFAAGARAHYAASRLAAPSMIAQRQGLIVNISFWAAQKHVANVAYGVSKAATDKLTADMAHELKEHNVAVVSLYPGLVRTEKVLEAAAWLDLSHSESPRFVGRAVVALSADPEILKRSGQILTTESLAGEYHFTEPEPWPPPGEQGEIEG